MEKFLYFNIGVLFFGAIYFEYLMLLWSEMDAQRSAEDRRLLMILVKELLISSLIY